MDIEDVKEESKEILEDTAAIEGGILELIQKEKDEI